MHEQSYRPGQKVPHSGVYQVSHDEHRPQHESTLIEGHLFPECAQCGQTVRFRLARSAASIDRDRDFRGKRRAHGA